MRVYSLLDRKYADKYGITQTELDEALRYEGLSDEANKLKWYYNGYNTAVPSLMLYNPWSMLNYLDTKRIEPYWIETGSTNHISDVMWSVPETRRDIVQLLKRKTLQVPIQVDVDLKSMYTAEGLWSLLYFSALLILFLLLLFLS